MASSNSLLDFAELLRPVAEANANGKTPGVAELCSRIERARAADDTLARGPWNRELKTADWNTVITLASDVIAQHRKDLKIAALLAEALTQKYGLAGLGEGLQLMRELLAQFWEALHPPIEDGDAEARAIQIEWLSKNLPPGLAQIPLTARINGAAYSWQDRRDALRIEDLERKNSEHAEAEREDLLAYGKITLKEFEQAINATPREFYTTLADDLQQGLEQILRLDEMIDEKFEAKTAPSLAPIKQVIADHLEWVEDILKKKPAPIVAEVSATPETSNDAGAPVLTSFSLPENSFETTPLTEAWPQALAFVKSGQLQNGLSLLTKRLQAARSRRERFLYQLQLAELCLAAGKPAPARPLVEELLAAVEKFHLEEWESMALNARVWRACHQCRDEPQAKQHAYDKLCQFDLGQALEVTTK